MPYVTGRILILIVTATIRLVVIATTLAGIAGACAVHAQETAPTPSWGDVGVNWSPVFWLEDLDVDYGTPPGVWVTWGTGTFRLQMEDGLPTQSSAIFYLLWRAHDRNLSRATRHPRVSRLATHGGEPRR